MRIRRRPPGQPLAYLLPSDPSAAPQPPPRASIDRQQERPPPPPGDKQGEGELHLHPATNDSAADLGDGRSRSSSSALRRPALQPQELDGAAEQRSGGGLGAQQQRRQGPSDGRSSLGNGRDRHVPEPVTIQAGERRLSNGVVGAAAVATTTATAGAKATRQQQEAKQDTGGGAKRAPRGPAGALVEGSRCSRKNGRGWRCSQPTLVGYALCQYHLGKGRMRSGSAATGGRGPGQLGRTEHAKKTSAAAAVASPAAAPKADVPPLPPSVQHC